MSRTATGAAASSDRTTLYHLAVLEDWNADAAGTTYVPAAFASEGFVHCSFRGQLAGVYDRYYAGRDDLVVLVFDRDALAEAVGAAAIREEQSPSTGELFPHVYAPLPRAAVREVLDLAAVMPGR